MGKFLFATIFCFLVLNFSSLSLSSEKTTAAVPYGQLKGFRHFKRVIDSRMIKPHMTPLVPFSLQPLLGQYRKQQGEFRFVNGDVTGISSFVYDNMVDRIVAIAIRACDSDFTLLQPGFAEALHALCFQHGTEEQFLKLWLNTMGFDAPRSEFIFWYQHFRHQLVTQLRLQKMVRGILLNPYFFLKS